MVEAYPLCLYAARFWPEHLRASENEERESDDLAHELALRLLKKGSVAYQNSCMVYNPEMPWQGLDFDDVRFISPGHYTSMARLRRVINSFIRKGVKITDNWFENAVYGAASRGDNEIIQDLLNAGATAGGNGYRVPIVATAAGDHRETVKLLLEAGADVNEDDWDNSGTAVFTAVASGHVETLKLLLTAGADPNAYAGMSGVIYAIDIAARNGNLEIFTLLLPGGLIDKAMNTAVDAGHRTLFKGLLKYEGSEAYALEYAVRGGWDDLVELLLKKRSQHQDSRYSSKGALYEAAAGGSLEMVNMILKNEKEAKQSTSKLDQALESAAFDGHAILVQFLLDRGADGESNECLEALAAAVRRGHLSLVQILLDAGVNPNYETRSSSYADSHVYGETLPLLYLAVLGGHFEIAHLLLLFGANVNARSSKHTALVESIMRNNEEMFHLLVAHGASSYTDDTKEWYKYDTLVLPLHHAATVGNEGILRILLDMGDHGVDDTIIVEGWTALFYAAKAGHDNCLNILIQEYHANINKRANGGILAIHTAVFYNCPRCVQVLLEAGIDINAASHSGKTALHWAAGEGSVNAVRLVMNKGASTSIEENHTHMKAIDLAMRELIKLRQELEQNPRLESSLREGIQRFETTAEILKIHTTES